MSDVLETTTPAEETAATVENKKGFVKGARATPNVANAANAGITEEAYKALSADEKRAQGYIHDPEVVYQCVEDKVENFSGNKEYTLEAYATVEGKKEKIPVGTKIHGMEEAHFNFNGVEVE